MMLALTWEKNIPHKETYAHFITQTFIHRLQEVVQIDFWQFLCVRLLLKPYNFSFSSAQVQTALTERVRLQW